MNKVLNEEEIKEVLDKIDEEFVKKDMIIKMSDFDMKEKKPAIRKVK